jgi:hypothetical protein
MPVPVAISIPAEAVVVVSEQWPAAERPAVVPAPAPPAAPDKPPAPRLALTDEKIKLAVAATLAERPDKADVPANRQDALLGATISGDPHNAEFARQFAYAKVPYCLGTDGLKFQPPKIGPIGFGGLLAIPFAVVAKLRGKCK